MQVSPLKLGFSEEKAARFGNLCADIAKRGQFILGVHTKELEKQVGDLLGGEALAFSACTDALEAVLKIAKLDYLYCPTMSFPSSLQAAYKAGVDIKLIATDCIGMRLDLDDLEEHLVGAKSSNRNVAVLLSHFGGYGYVNSASIKELCRRTDTLLIEDFSHSWGAEVFAQSVGTFGDVAVASLLATKPMHAGTGGVVIDRTPGHRFMRELEAYRVYGRVTDLSGGSLGTNYLVYQGGSWRMSEMEAALALLNLSDFDEEVEARRWVLDQYEDALSMMYDPPLGLESNGYRAFYRTRSPKQLIAKLKADGIELVGKVYDRPVHEVPVIKSMFSRQFLSLKDNSQDWCDTHICLPCYGGLTKEEVSHVIDSVLRAERDVRPGKPEVSTVPGNSYHHVG